jgi:hypothetical protein
MFEFVSGITSAAKGLAATAKGIFDSVTGAIEDFFSTAPRHGIYLNRAVSSIFNGVGIMDIEVQLTKAVASHPLETNKSLQDNVVFEPRTASVILLVESGLLSQFYSELGQLYYSNTLVMLQVDDIMYPDMLLSSLPIQRDPGIYDALQITLGFHEYIQKTAATSKMSDPSNVELARYADRQKAGLQRPQTVSGADEISVKARMTVPGA